MATLSIRTDPETDAVLQQLGEQYGNTTNTIKIALQHLAAEQRREALRQEAIAAANDPADRAEMMAVLRQMEALGEG